MNRAGRLAAVILPLAGLAALWGLADYQSRQGTLWDVPITGYDPRDFLRGHYAEFQYDWPGLEDAATAAPPTGLCLFGQAPVITRTIRADDKAALAACRNPARLDTGAVYGRESLQRGRLYLGQDRARQVDEQLRNRDQRAIVTIRQRADGTITPLDIRFRALTRQERAERGAREGTQPMIRRRR